MLLAARVDVKLQDKICVINVLTIEMYFRWMIVGLRIYLQIMLMGTLVEISGKQTESLLPL